VTALGLDETSFLKTTRVAPTRWVTGLVDLDRGRLLDVVADRTSVAVDGWLGARPAAWLAQVATVALDPWRGYASALTAPLGHARVVVDHVHAIRLANTVVDQVRRRAQQATLGHWGRKPDPLYRIRKLLLTAAEQLTQRGQVRLRAGLTAGDPTGEVAAAWQGKELLRAVYAAVGTAAARAALERFYRWADTVGVAELSRLARTVKAWRPRSWPSTPSAAAPTDPPRRSTCSPERCSGSGTASGTSPTTGYGYCCTTAAGGRRTQPRACEAAHHACWRSACHRPWCPSNDSFGRVGLRASRPARVGPALSAGVRPPQGIRIVP
jgi:Transposase